MHRQERKASLQFAVVCLLVVLIFAVRSYLRQHDEPNYQTIAYYQQRADAWAESQKSIAENTQKPHSAVHRISSKKQPITIDRFDPNTLNDDGWLSMGLSEKQLKTLRNFQEKGGYFYSLEDLQKVYSLNEEFISEYGQYADFPPRKENKTSIIEEDTSFNTDDSKLNTASLKEQNQKIDINAADSTQLVGLYGVGPFYARQILRKRNELGGFAQMSQLKEVWKMRDETYQALLEQTEIMSSPHCLHINLASAEELAKHPYINWNLARSMVNFREVNGQFQHIDELKKLHLMQDSVYIQLQPYLCIDDINR